jgi:hypothetical protein
VSSEEQTRADGAPAAAVTCAECLAPVEAPLVDRKGSSLCAACAEAYYAACGQCKQLVAQDETKSSDGVPYCLECYDATFGARPEGAPSEAEAETLAAEYVALHAEHKKIGERLDEIKELLKNAAIGRERAGSAVTFRSDAGSVKCSFQTKVKWDNERVAELEGVLGPERFASLFDRKVSFSPVKSAVDSYLSSASEADAEVRDALLSACEKVETPVISVVPKKG